MIYPSLFSMSYFKGFSVMRTLNIQETALMLCHIARKLFVDRVRPEYYTYSVNNNAGFNNNDDCNGGTNNTLNATLTQNQVTNVNHASAYTTVAAKRVKRDNVNRDNIGEIMLTSIPGVGAVVAQTILGLYNGQITQLMAAIVADPDNWANSVNTLITASTKTDAVKTKTTTFGKKQKAIPLKTLSTIIEYLRPSIPNTDTNTNTNTNTDTNANANADTNTDTNAV
jgi:hypothetical protein